MADRSKDWMAQAERDLETARMLRNASRHEWACFAAQQAAEKALKGAHLSQLREVRGHVVRQLLEELGDVPAELLDKARVLDGYYIPTRYANSHEDGAPYRHYGMLQSEQAISYAGEIINLARTRMAQER